MTDRAAELAYVEAVRALEEQQASRESALARVGTTFGVAGVATGVLAPSALDGHAGIPWLGWVALLLLVVAAASSVYVMWPREWTWTVKADTLVGDDWLGREDDDVNRWLALYLHKHKEGNKKGLSRCWTGVRITLAATAASIIAWVMLLGGVWS